MRRPPFARPGLLGLMMLLLAPVAVAQPSDDDLQQRPPANPADVGSVDAIITAAYDVLSGPIGQPAIGIGRGRCFIRRPGWPIPSGNPAAKPPSSIP